MAMNINDEQLTCNIKSSVLESYRAMAKPGGFCRGRGCALAEIQVGRELKSQMTHISRSNSGIWRFLRSLVPFCCKNYSFNRSSHIWPSFWVFPGVQMHLVSCCMDLHSTYLTDI